MITINYEKCCWKDGRCVNCSCGGKCNGCVETSPTGALEKRDIVVLHSDRCLECEACASAYKYNATMWNA